MNSLLKIFKRILFSFGLLYSYNIIMNQFNIPIPINIFNIIFITIFDFPGLLGLILFYLINF